MQDRYPLIDDCDKVIAGPLPRTRATFLSAAGDRPTLKQIQPERLWRHSENISLLPRFSMKTIAFLAAAILLSGCAGTGHDRTSGASQTYGSSGSGGKALNSDVSEAVLRGSTHGFDPQLSPERR